MELFMLFVPLVMIICGIFMYRFSPRGVNGLVGYRTIRSTKNSDTWLFANRYCGKLWIILGSITLLLSAITVIVLLVAGIEFSDTIALVAESIELAVLLGSIIPVEIALRRRFDENGKRR